MIQIEEKKIAEMMFDIWHNSESLKNPVMVGEYIANKLKEAITVTRCCEELCEVCNNDQVFETEDGYTADCPRCN